MRSAAKGSRQQKKCVLKNNVKGVNMIMPAKKVIIGLVAVLGLTLLGISVGYAANNSAPNFECITCHAGEVGTDMVKIQGVPKTYVPGKIYKLTLTVTSKLKSEGDVAGGFAVKATSGELLAKDKKNTQLSDGILTHTKEGSAVRKWSFEWKAPKEKVDEMSISTMAIAANGDFSPAGDIVGVASYTIKSGK